MSIKVGIRDSGTDLEAKVHYSGENKEPSLWTHISGVGQKTTLPTFLAPLSGAELFDTFLLNAESEQMAVNGSVTPVNFRIEADATKDIVVTSLIFSGQDGSVKYSNWFSSNSPLTTGVILSFKSDDITTTFPAMKTTTRLIAFSSGSVESASITGESIVVSFRKFDPPIIIRASGSHVSGQNDYIQVKISDNLTFMEDFTCTVRGFKVEKGLL